MKRQIKVEYKETEVFELFPDFTYTKQQRVRTVLFHAYKNNIAKIIRYAANFDLPNKICLIYIVGQPKEEKIMAELINAGCSDRVCVLTSLFPDEKLQFYKDFDKLRSSLIGAGLYDKERQELSEKYMSYHKTLSKAIKKQEIRTYDQYDMLCDLFQKEEREIEMVHQYHRLVKTSRNTYFKKFTCYRIGHLPKPFTHGRLDELIQKVFPYGTEATGISDYSALSSAAIDLVFKSYPAFDKKLNFVVNDETPGVKYVRRVINRQLKEKGYCDLNELSLEICSPPCGFSRNAYSIACVLYVLRQFDNRNMFVYDTVGTFPLKQSLYGVCSNIFDLETKRKRNMFLYMESHPHKVIKRMLSEVFGVKMEMPGFNMAMRVRQSLSEHCRLPLSTVDQRLFSLVSMDFEWYDLCAATKLCQEIEGREQELKNVLQEYYRIDSTLSEDERKCYAWAAPWLWKYDHVEYKEGIQV